MLDQIKPLITEASIEKDLCLQAQLLTQAKELTMQLGTLSISLAIKSIESSRFFYEKFGFKLIGGDASQNCLILKNSGLTIALFQVMFEKNLSFNPGWDNNAEEIDINTDIRDRQRQLNAQDVELLIDADEATSGLASFVLVDTDVNPNLVDHNVLNDK